MTKETISLLDAYICMLTFLWLHDPSYGVYIIQFVKFASICNNVHMSDFNDNRKLLQQGYRFHIFLKTFTKITAI